MVPIKVWGLSWVGENGGSVGRSDGRQEMMNPRQGGINRAQGGSNGVPAAPEDGSDYRHRRGCRSEEPVVWTQTFEDEGLGGWTGGKVGPR